MSPSLPIHFIDFEGSVRTGVVEFGVATWIDGAVTDCATTLCEPRLPLWRTESAIHGITQEDTIGQARFETHWPRFRALRMQGILGAHNKVVEDNLINQVWPDGAMFPTFQDTPDTPGWGPWIDTRWLVPRLYSGVGPCGLMELVAQFDLNAELEALAHRHCPPRRNRPHCALYDALASALLFQKCWNDFEAQRGNLLFWLDYSRPHTTENASRQTGFDFA